MVSCVSFQTIVSVIAAMFVGIAVPANAAEPDASFTFTTRKTTSQFVYEGVDESIEGKRNPRLKVDLGDVVEITLINEDGSPHDIRIDAFDAASAVIEKKGTRDTFRFTADKAGTFPYYCTVTGHTQAGMHGKLVVAGETGSESLTAPDLSLSPTAAGSPLDRGPATVRTSLVAKERTGKLSESASYGFWTYNGTVPGPFLRIRHNDTVEMTFVNEHNSSMTHSVDFHATTGPGGGAAVLDANAGESRTLTFKALNPGIYIYHCATPMIAHHIANGLFGLILVEPEGGLPPVDREFVVVQSEVYTRQSYGTEGRLDFSEHKLLKEEPEYVLLNGREGALTDDNALQAEVGETIRIFFGVAGPNLTSSFHVIGEIFDRVYLFGDLTSPPARNVQSVTVPPGGAVAVEFTVEVPGRYLLVDHALSRLSKGCLGHLDVSGPENPEVFREGRAAE